MGSVKPLAWLYDVLRGHPINTVMWCRKGPDDAESITGSMHYCPRCGLIVDPLPEKDIYFTEVLEAHDDDSRRH